MMRTITSTHSNTMMGIATADSCKYVYVRDESPTSFHVEGLVRKINDDNKTNERRDLLT